MRIAFRRYVLGPVLFVSAGCMPASQPAANSGAAAPRKGGAESAPADPATLSESTSRSEEQLVEAYKAAHSCKDAEGLLAMYWFGSADAEMRQAIRENVAAELRCPLVDVKIEPVQPGEHGPREEGGVRWRPSLEVVALLTANFDIKSAPAGGFYTSQVRLTVGRHGNCCYFAVPLRE